MPIHIIDRRLNPGGKSLENRQRFLRRAKSLVQGAVKKTSQERDIKDVLEGGEVTIPLDGMHEPRFRREGGTRDMVLPGNKKFIEGDYLQRSGQGSAKDSGPGEGDSEDAFRFVLSRDEFVDLFLDDLELPDLAKRKIAQTESEGIQRAGYTTSGSPANISVSRTVKLALARRIALKRPRKEEIEELEAAIAACTDEDERVVLLAELERLKARTKRIPFVDPLDIRYRRYEKVPRPVAQAVMFCLMDVSGSMSEHMKDLAKRFYMLLYVFLKGATSMSRSSSSATPTAPRRSTSRPSFTARPRAARWSPARCRRCTRSCASASARRTGTSTPRKLPTATIPIPTASSPACC